MSFLAVKRHWWFLVVIYLIIFSMPTALQAQSPSDDLNVMATAFELEVISLVNAERVARGLAPLQLNDDLTQAARAHNQDMIVNNFFSHTGSNGSIAAERAYAAGYTPYAWGDCYVAENIAAGQSTPEAVFTSWMDSPGHRNNILDPDYREIGVGHSTGGFYGDYWTLNLGTQPNVLPVFINNDSNETTTRQISLTLTSETVSSWGSLGNITAVQVSEDPSFSGAVWTSWVQPLPFELSPGNGTKTVYVKLSDGNKEVISSDSITLNVPLPALALTPGNLTFTIDASTQKIIPEAVSLRVDNLGSGELDWLATSDASWLQIDTDQGCAPYTLQVRLTNVDELLDLPTGTVAQANITITATTPNAQDTPQTIPVTLNVVDQLHTVYIPFVMK